MSTSQHFLELYGDFSDQAMFTQPNMPPQQPLPSLQAGELYFDGNEDLPSASFNNAFYDGLMPEGEIHSRATQHTGYMPQRNCAFDLYPTQPSSQSYSGQSDFTYAAPRLYNGHETLPQDARNYSAMAAQHQTPPQSHQNGYRPYNGFNETFYDGFQLTPQLYDQPVTAAENNTATLADDLGCASTFLPVTPDSPLLNVEGNKEHVDPSGPRLHKRKIAKACSQSSKSTSSIPSPGDSSIAPLSPRAKNDNNLVFNGFAEAEAVAFNRARPTLRDDDWTDVKSAPHKHVHTLLAAFGKSYAQAPEQFALVKDADKSRWITYQEGHVEKMSKYDDQTLEAACWVLLKHLIEAHEVGMKTLRYHKIEGNIKCSDHVDLVASAIRKYAVIRYDVVRLQRLDELVCCTTSAVSRKIANFKGNWNKTERENENQEKAEKLGIDYTPVLGDKKRKAADGGAGAGAAGGATATTKPARRRVRSLRPTSEDTSAVNSTIKPTLVSPTTSDNDASPTEATTTAATELHNPVANKPPNPAPSSETEQAAGLVPSSSTD